jgi:beta-lactam-binding protein with PASTA domain
MLSTVWVLIVMTVFMGEPATKMINHFDSKQQCEAALAIEAHKRAKLPHAQGGGSFYQCSVWQG